MERYPSFVSSLLNAKEGVKIAFRDYTGKKSCFISSRTQKNGWNFVMYKMVNSMLRPLKSLTGAVGNFSGDDMSVRADVTSNDEIGILAKTFNAMAETIDEHSRTLESKVEERTLDLANQCLMQNLRENNDDAQILDGADVAMLLIDAESGRLVFSGAGLSVFAVLTRRGYGIQRQ